jgi:hypothetical protein
MGATERRYASKDSTQLVFSFVMHIGPTHRSLALRCLLLGVLLCGCAFAYQGAATVFGALGSVVIAAVMFLGGTALGLARSLERELGITTEGRIGENQSANRVALAAVLLGLAEPVSKALPGIGVFVGVACVGSIMPILLLSWDDLRALRTSTKRRAAMRILALICITHLCHGFTLSAARQMFHGVPANEEPIGYAAVSSGALLLLGAAAWGALLLLINLILMPIQHHTDSIRRAGDRHGQWLRNKLGRGMGSRTPES